MKTNKENDLQVLEEIVKKHNLTVDEIEKLIGSEKKHIRKQIRFSDEEIARVDSRACKYGMKRSEYTLRCAEKALDDKLYMSFDIRRMKRDTYNTEVCRNNRVSIYFKDEAVYEKIQAFAKKFSLPLTTLIREIVLSVEL